MFTKTIHCGPLWEKTFLCTSIFYTWQTFFCTRIRTLLFTSHGLYIQTLFKDFFIFPNTHLWFTQRFLHIHSLLTHTRIPFRASFTHKDPLYTFSFYIHVQKTFFFSLQTWLLFTTLLFLFSFYFWFILFFRTTFLNEKFYAIPEF